MLEIFFINVPYYKLAYKAYLLDNSIINNLKKKYSNNFCLYYEICNIYYQNYKDVKKQYKLQFDSMQEDVEKKETTEKKYADCFKKATEDLNKSNNENNDNDNNNSNNNNSNNDNNNNGNNKNKNLNYKDKELLIPNQIIVISKKNTQTNNKKQKTDSEIPDININDSKDDQTNSDQKNNDQTNNEQTNNEQTNNLKPKKHYDKLYKKCKIFKKIYRKISLLTHPSKITNLSQIKKTDEDDPTKKETTEKNTMNL